MSLRSVSTIGLLVSAAFVAAGVLAGCVVTKEETNTNGGGNSGPVYPFPTESDFCLAKAKAECNSKVQGLCNTTVDACVKGRSDSSVCNPANLPYMPSPAQACIDALTSAWSDGVLDYNEIISNTKACTPVFTNAHIAGASCQQPGGTNDLPSAAVVGWQIGPDADCDTASGLACLITEAGKPGTCVKPNVLTAGDDCSVQNSVCGENLYCNAGTCAKAKKLGEACTAEKLCETDLLCQNGSCAAREANGTACKSDTECVGKDGPWGYCITDTSGNNGQCFDTFQLNAFANSCKSFK
jgi:hypothetical protein